MKKIIILLLFSITSTFVIAQTTENLPTGYLPFSTQIFRKIVGTDTTFITGGPGRGYTLIPDARSVKILKDSINSKVTKIDGKGLSERDYSTAEKNKLSGISIGATANQSDAFLLARQNHTGTQPISTVANLQATLDGKMVIDGGNNITGNQNITDNGYFRASTFIFRDPDINGAGNLGRFLTTKIITDNMPGANGVLELNSANPDGTIKRITRLYPQPYNYLGVNAIGVLLPTTSGVLINRVNLDAFRDSVQLRAEKGIANGYASLDINGKVPLVQINDALLGAVNYKGTYNVVTNTPTLPTPVTANKGWYYLVSNLKAVFQGDSVFVNDWVISNGVVWNTIRSTRPETDPIYRSEKNTLAQLAVANVFTANANTFGTASTNRTNIYPGEIRTDTQDGATRSGINSSSGLYWYRNGFTMSLFPKSNTLTANRSVTIRDRAGDLAFLDEIPSLTGYAQLATNNTFTGALNTFSNVGGSNTQIMAAMVKTSNPDNSASISMATHAVTWKLGTYTTALTAGPTPLTKDQNVYLGNQSGYLAFKDDIVAAGAGYAKIDGSNAMGNWNNSASYLKSYKSASNVLLGWDGFLNLRIDGTDFGKTFPIDISGGASSATLWGGAQADFLSNGTSPNSIIAYDAVAGKVKPFSHPQIKAALATSFQDVTNVNPVTSNTIFSTGQGRPAFPSGPATGIETASIGGNLFSYDYANNSYLPVNINGGGASGGVTIVPGGRLGVGTQFPSYSLVVSNNGANGFEVDPTTGSGTTTLSYNRTTNLYTDRLDLMKNYRISSGGGTGSGSINLDGNVGISGTLTGTSFSGNSLTLAPDNAISDPYAAISVTRTAANENTAYYGLTKSGTTAYMIGIGNDNRFSIGTGTRGNITNHAFLMDTGGNLSLKGSLTIPTGAGNLQWGNGYEGGSPTLAAGADFIGIYPKGNAANVGEVVRITATGISTTKNPTLPEHLARKDYVDSRSQSGLFTPIGSSTVGLTTLNFINCKYSKVGNMVTVFGFFQIEASSAETITFNMTKPMVSADESANHYATGSIASINNTNVGYINSANGTIKVQCKAILGGGTQGYSFSYSYMAN